MDPGRSRFTVQAFAGGLLSIFAHSPTFAVREFKGELRLKGDTPEDTGLEVIVRADALELMDNVKPADRQEIEGRMRREVLEVAVFPEIRFQSSEIVATPIDLDRYHLRIVGQLSLHGVTKHERVDAELRLYDDGVRLAGESPLRLADYRIRPVTALGGAIQLRDQLRVVFDLVAVKEAS
jgi:polyisoprenoid-binding protein YceI